MGEDASLDQFTADDPDDESEESDAGAASADTDTATGSAAEPAATDDADGPAAEDEPPVADDSAADAVEPARTTYAWDGAGAACGACGETVERRWQGDGGLVCIECKDWDRP